MTLKAPKNGVRIRMYRQGHGDCFLLVFRKDDGKPFFMLIDCGRKGGSTPKDLTGPDKKNPKIVGMPEVLDQLFEDTGGQLDVVVVTHEHQDHVSGFPRPDDLEHRMRDFHIEDLWLAWTEDGSDALAEKIREDYGDKLLALAMAHQKALHLAEGKRQTRATEKGLALDDVDLSEVEYGQMAVDLAEFLELETGLTQGSELLEILTEETDGSFAAKRQNAFGLKGKKYKLRMKGLRDLTKGEIKFLSPGDDPLPLPGVSGVRFYPFGPPRDQKLLTSLNPRRDEEFHFGPFNVDQDGFGLFAAFDQEGAVKRGDQPFASRFTHRASDIQATPPPETVDLKSSDKDRTQFYLAESYFDPSQDHRTIDGDWLSDSEALALRLNKEVNNTSLVLALEFTNSGKVALFTGDAQRGSWVSWADLSWNVDGKDLSAKELLSRCVLYKAGHHGSHNATLHGDLDSPHANLSWMALGPYESEFVAMVPSNKNWAWGKSRPWRHPMAQIEDALVEKSKSRVLLIDPPGPRRAPAFAGSEHDPMWDEFEKRCEGSTNLAVEYWLPDDGVPGP